MEPKQTTGNIPDVILMDDDNDKENLVPKQNSNDVDSTFGEHKDMTPTIQDIGELYFSPRSKSLQVQQ